MVKQENGPTDPRVARARQLRRTMTNAERKLWWYLRRLPNENAHFRRQATIGRYYADFACHHHRLVIEVDGGGHADDQQIAADARRTEFLTARGYRVLRSPHPAPLRGATLPANGREGNGAASPHKV